MGKAVKVHAVKQKINFLFEIRGKVQTRVIGDDR